LEIRICHLRQSRRKPLVARPYISHIGRRLSGFPVGGALPHPPGIAVKPHRQSEPANHRHTPCHCKLRLRTLICTLPSLNQVAYSLPRPGLSLSLTLSYYHGRSLFYEPRSNLGAASVCERPVCSSRLCNQHRTFPAFRPNQGRSRHNVDNTTAQELYSSWLVFALSLSTHTPLWPSY